MNDRFIIPEGKSVKLKDYSSALTKPYGSKAEADEKLKKANNEFPVQPLAPIFPAGRMVARDARPICPSGAGAKAQRDHEYLYWEFPERGFGQAVRVGRWKAIRPKPGAPLELYDLVSDPSEQHDIAPAHPEILARDEAILATDRTDSPHWPVDLQGDCESKPVDLRGRRDCARRWSAYATA